MRLFLFSIICALGCVPLQAFGADDLSRRVAGQILLDVESAGQAWYVSPVDLMRYELGKPEQAWDVMRAFGLGIRDAHLAQIPDVDEAEAGDMALRRRLAGRILLQVESHGEAWYVHPGDLKRRYLGRPQDAFEVMRSLGLGISKQDLSAVPAGTLVQAPLPNIPFIAQAPRGDWEDLRQQEGCEEASVLMAVAWARGLSFDAQQAEAAIINMAEYQKARFGYFIDTSAHDTYNRLFRSYFFFSDARYEEQVGTDDILRELAAGNLVIITANGRALNNPNFRAGGPLRHMLVVLGYDHANGEFITHEPGTSRGAYYRYSHATIQTALNDYSSGEYAPLPQPPRTAMIVVEKP